MNEGKKSIERNAFDMGVGVGLVSAGLAVNNKFERKKLEKLLDLQLDAANAYGRKKAFSNRSLRGVVTEEGKNLLRANNRVSSKTNSIKFNNKAIKYARIASALALATSGAMHLGKKGGNNGQR